MSTLQAVVKTLPNLPGVYIFKNSLEEIIYIGKAKNLKSRVSSYFQHDIANVKASLIVVESTQLEHIVTETELEAMLLEAKLIQRYQPKYNVLLKDGQPFLYIMVTAPTVYKSVQRLAKKLPQLLVVRNRKLKGTYFGPFIEKGPVRKVYQFLMRTFKLQLCTKKMEHGCLYFHMGICAGNCKSDFNEQDYLQRLELAQKALKQGHKKFLSYLQEEIAQSNQRLAFEASKELHGYYQAFEKVFISLNADTVTINALARLDVWILTPDHTALFLLSEQDGVLKKRREFHFIEGDSYPVKDMIEEYVVGYYRSFMPASIIIANFDFEKDQAQLISEFLQEWHKLATPVLLQRPQGGHLAQVIRLAQVQVDVELDKQRNLPQALKRMLKLSIAPRIIDCFDISHKQGTFLVGACVRFVDGKPEKNKFRRFTIKTVHQNDDYACLREVVSRRYHEGQDFPDLILIDGGKGQLNAVQDLFPQLPFISLAKREETVFSQQFPDGKVLDQKAYAAQTLLALRDYTHHFAISYHRLLAKIS